MVRVWEGSDDVCMERWGSAQDVGVEQPADTPAIRALPPHHSGFTIQDGPINNHMHRRETIPTKFQSIQEKKYILLMAPSGSITNQVVGHLQAGSGVEHYPLMIFV